MSYRSQRSFEAFAIVVAIVVVWHEVGSAQLARPSRHARTVERRRRAFSFRGGLAVLAPAVISPVDDGADDSFFVHVIEHMSIMIFAPILIAAGAPWLPPVHALPVTMRRRVGRVSLSPFADQQIGAGILGNREDFWVLPALVWVIHRAVEEEGPASALVDRLLHRAPLETLPEVPRG